VPSAFAIRRRSDVYTVLPPTWISICMIYWVGNLSEISSDLLGDLSFITANPIFTVPKSNFTFNLSHISDDQRGKESRFDEVIL